MCKQTPQMPFLKRATTLSSRLKRMSSFKKRFHQAPLTLISLCSLKSTLSTFWAILMRPSVKQSLATLDTLMGTQFSSRRSQLLTLVPKILSRMALNLWVLIKVEFVRKNPLLDLIKRQLFQVTLSCHLILTWLTSARFLWLIMN